MLHYNQVNSIPGMLSLTFSIWQQMPTYKIEINIIYNEKIYWKILPHEYKINWSNPILFNTNWKLQPQQVKKRK